MAAGMDAAQVTSRQLAEALGIDRRTVQAWRADKRRPKIGFQRFADAIQNVTGVSVRGTSADEVLIDLERGR